MNAEIMKRLVRAIAEGSQLDLDRLAHRVVDAERKAGHTRLAHQLETILRDSRRSRIHRAPPPANVQTGLTTLPQSRRSGEELAEVIEREQLEHHMVLPKDIEERFTRIECEYAARERLGAYGLHPRKRILLHGPPGCGKSLGAKRLAWNTGLPLMKVRFDVLLSSFFGESAANLRAIFTAARQRPCVLLLDECDFIARSRTQSRDIGEANRIVNALLQLMEDYDAPGLLVATTNIESSLDEALFRRFDEVLRIPAPGPTEIDRLLRITLSSVAVDSSVDWSNAVRELQGLSAAVVVKAARDAAKSAVLNGGRTVSGRHLDQAISELHRTESSDQGTA